MVVRRRSFPIGMVAFQGQAVKLQLRGGSKHEKNPLIGLDILLMVQKSGYLGCIPNPVNTGITCQPQLVQDYFHQQYVVPHLSGEGC